MQCEIAQRLFELLSAIETKKKKPIDCGDGNTLYRAEAYLLNMINEFPGSNVTFGICPLHPLDKPLVTFNPGCFSKELQLVQIF